MKKLILALGLIAALLLSSFGIAAAQDDAWRVGVILPITGPLSKNGTKNFTGVKIATEMINDRGGINGKKVEIVSADAPDPQAAASEANRLINQENLTCIIGTQASSLSMAATTVAEKNQVFYLENEGVSGLITGRDFKYLVRTTFSGRMMAYQMVDYTVDVLAPKMGKDASDLKVAIIHEDGGFGTSTGTAITARAEEKKLDIALNQSYSAKTTDLSAMILKLRSVRPDVIFAAQYINDAILFHRQAAELGLDAVVFGTTAGQGNPDFQNAFGDEANGVLAGGIPAAISYEGLSGEPKEDAMEFVERYAEHTNGEYPNPTAFVGFAGAWILYKFILPQAGSLDPDQLRRAAAELDVQPGQGVLNWGVKFNQGGQNVYATSGVNQWQKGELKLVFPHEVSNAELMWK
jgi:branched-chain amino acid transport system substrate-binding protein